MFGGFDFVLAQTMVEYRVSSVLPSAVRKTSHSAFVGFSYSIVLLAAISSSFPVC